MNTTFEVKDVVRAVNIKPLAGNLIAPPLELDKEYVVQSICLDSEGNQHLNVGLTSAHNYVRSFDTEEELPDSSMGKIHWCHPSRFVKATKE